MCLAADCVHDNVFWQIAWISLTCHTKTKNDSYIWLYAPSFNFAYPPCIASS